MKMLPPIKLCVSKSDGQKVKNQKHAPKAKVLTPITLSLCASSSDGQKVENHKDVTEAKNLSPIKLSAVKSDEQKAENHKDGPKDAKLSPIVLCTSKTNGKKHENHKDISKAKKLSPIILCPSKPDGQKAKNQKHVPKVKQPKPNWLDLPSDLTTNILQRVGAVDILKNAEKVCTTWRIISKDPALWKVIHLDGSSGKYTRTQLLELCKKAVDRSQGQVVDITLLDFGIDEVIKYISKRASHLKRLENTNWYSNDLFPWGADLFAWGDALENLSSLEELSLQQTGLSAYTVKILGRHCPLLKTLKANVDPPRSIDEECDVLSRYIGKYLPELRHLELIGDGLSNIGLRAILDGCSHLESLDLRMCFNIDLKADADLRKRCSEQIKHLKLSPASFDSKTPQARSGVDYPYSWDYGSYSGGSLCSHFGCECGTPDDPDNPRWTEVYVEYCS